MEDEILKRGENTHTSATLPVLRPAAVKKNRDATREIFNRGDYFYRLDGKILQIKWNFVNYGIIQENYRACELFLFCTAAILKAFRKCCWLMKIKFLSRLQSCKSKIVVCIVLHFAFNGHEKNFGEEIFLEIRKWVNSCIIYEIYLIWGFK